jgi:hypothetical protein
MSSIPPTVARSRRQRAHSSAGGTVRPSAFAVTKLMVNSNLVGSAFDRAETVFALQREMLAQPKSKTNGRGALVVHEMNV